MSIILDDVSSLLYLLIKGISFDHSIITRPSALEMMVAYLGDDAKDAQKEIDDIRECHARFSFLEKMYIYHLVVTVKANGDDAQVLHDRCIQSYLMYLIGMSIFMDKNAYYIYMVYRRYFIDFNRIHEYN